MLVFPELRDFSKFFSSSKIFLEFFLEFFTNSKILLKFEIWASFWEATGKPKLVIVMAVEDYVVSLLRVGPFTCYTSIVTVIHPYELMTKISKPAF